jgi:hypothetical protein
MAHGHGLLSRPNERKTHDARRIPTISEIYAADQEKGRWPN